MSKKKESTQPEEEIKDETTQEETAENEPGGRRPAGVSGAVGLGAVVPAHLSVLRGKTMLTGVGGGSGRRFGSGVLRADRAVPENAEAGAPGLPPHGAVLRRGPADPPLYPVCFYDFLFCGLRGAAAFHGRGVTRNRSAL